MNNLLEMTICASLEEAVAKHDANAEFGMYSGYENVKSEHERFFAEYPRLASKWLYCAADNTVWHITKNKGQRILNKHGLVDSISAGKMNFVMASKIDDNTMSFHVIAATCNKADLARRSEWCSISADNYLTSDAA